MSFDFEGQVHGTGLGLVNSVCPVLGFENSVLSPVPGLEVCSC